MREPVGEMKEKNRL